MPDEAEHQSRRGESFPTCALNPQRSTATSARCSSPLAIRVPAMRMTPLACLAWAGSGSKLRGRLQCKSTVYGLNGLRPTSW